MFSQVDSKDFDNLICKEWLLKAYEEDGEKFSPAPEQQNDLMIFYKNKEVKSIESGNIQNGVWQYNSRTNELVILDNDTKEKTILKVLKLTQNECIIEYKEPEGTSLKMYMVPKL